MERVKEAITMDCPGVEFYREPTGSEKLASVPEIEFPQVLRDHLKAAPAQDQGDLDGSDYSVRFFLGESNASVVYVVDVEARGTTRNALPPLERLARHTGWIVVDASGNVVAKPGAA
jgi:hypothetical protein